MTITYINPDNHHAPLGRYSHAALVGPGWLAFIAGQVAVDKAGTPVPGDAGAQGALVFRNLAEVLDGIGASFSDVVELTTYLVGEDSREPWFAARDALYAEHFGDGPYPPNTLLIISGLARPELKVEISAVVRMPDGAQD